MTTEELHKIEEMIELQIIPEIEKLIHMKHFNANLKNVSEDSDFVYVDLLVYDCAAQHPVNVEMILDKNTLYSRGCCSDLDKWGKYADQKDQMPLVKLVKLRILRLVFSVIKNTSAGAIKYNNNKITVAFGSKLGALWYY